MKYIAIIFARAGSKGLPGKNNREFAGKPLLAWSIEHALSIDRIERVIVSTDSEDIAKVARKYGADVPFIRPAELSGDDSPEWLAWRHALKFVENEIGNLPEVMVSIPTTAPLRQTEDIEKCLDKYEEGNIDVVITVSESHRSPYFNMVMKNDNGTVGLVLPSKSTIYQRQDVPSVYDMTTICYVVNSAFIFKHNSIFEGRMKAIKVPKERAIDIDTILDFKIAEFIFSNYITKK